MSSSHEPRATDPRLRDSKIGLIGIPVFLILILIVFINLIQL